MQAARQRPVQYPWGTQCPLRWPKVFLAALVPHSGRALEALTAEFPHYELFASGEILFDLSRQQRAFRSPVQMAETLMARLREVFPEADGNSLSAGLAADAFTGLYAARLQRDELQLVPAWDARRVLSGAPVEHLDGVISGVSALLRSMGYRQLGDLSRQRDPVLNQRYGELGRAVHLLARGQSVPRQYWYLTPPQSLSVAARLSGDARSWAEQVDGVRERLQGHYARLGFEAGQWQLSYRRGERTPFTDVSGPVELVALADGGPVEFRWRAGDWYKCRVQQDLFDLEQAPSGPVGMPLYGVAGSTVAAS